MTKENAEKVSFVELLNVPTVGQRSTNNKLFFEMLNSKHLEWIESVIFSGNKKIVLTSSDFYNRYLKILQKDFSFFKSIRTNLKPLSEEVIKNVTFFNCYHFSSSQVYETISVLKDKLEP